MSRRIIENEISYKLTIAINELHNEGIYSMRDLIEYKNKLWTNFDKLNSEELHEISKETVEEYKERLIYVGEI